MYYFSIGARPKFTKRNSMDSVELWKYSSDKVISYTPERNVPVNAIHRYLPEQSYS